MKILAIETSCDETAISVLEAKENVKHPVFNILSNIVASQVKIHAKWGGVVPNLAKREHQTNLIPILKKVLKESNLLISNFQFPISKQILNSKFSAKGGSASGGKILNSILEREQGLRKKITPFLKKYQTPKIDLIAVTQGPGLEPALWVGINFAKALAYFWDKPLIGINHLEGHITSVFLKKQRNFQFSIFNFQFPAIGLVVSGGHTQLLLIKDWLKYKLLGETLDDAAGEAFDKVAKMLGFGYPGGPSVAEAATKIKNQKLKIKSIVLPRPMLNSKDYNFSFSGLKTAVLYLLRDLGNLAKLEKKSTIMPTIPSVHDREYLVSTICKEFQQAIIDVLVKKTIAAAKEYKAKTIVLGGGVAANKELRSQLEEKVANTRSSGYLLNLLVPEMEFTGDNAAMIALAAYFRWIKQKRPAKLQALKANGNLKIS